MKPALVRSVLLVVASFWLVPAALFADASYWIRKTGPGGVKPGEQVTYTIELSNAGPDAVPDAIVTDPTPPGLDPGPVTGACAVLPCTVALAASTTTTITATFSVPVAYSGPDPIVNTASISSPTVTDSIPGDNTASVSTAVNRVQGFFSLPPCRVADTRGASGVPIGGPALEAGKTRTLNVRELCGLPGNAIAVSYNITVTQPTGAGDLRFFPEGEPALASAINYVSGQTRANNGIVKIPTSGGLVAQCDQASGSVHFIMDVNGYFTANDLVPVPQGKFVRVRVAPEVEITFDDVKGGNVSAQVIEFLDDRPTPADKNLQDFFPLGSPERALLPSVMVPSYVQALPKGGPGGPPTFVLAIIDTDAPFSRTAEFHGFEDFRLGWDPPCVNPDPTQEPRTFYAREAPKNEPFLVEETSFESPVFVDISSGCGSNKGSGWNFSLYLTGRDSRTPLQIADFMLQNMEDVLSNFSNLIVDSAVGAQLLAEVQAARRTLTTSPPTSSLANVNNWIAVVDQNPQAFNNGAGRNFSGELVGRGQAARYMIGKLLPTGTAAEFRVPTSGAWPFGVTAGPDGNVWFTEVLGEKVGRVTPAGVLTEFSVPTGGSQPANIVTGPDGNLWFAEHTAHKITRVTTAGVMTEFPTPSASNPYGMAAGPDGNLWYTGYFGNKIGRVTPAGTITEFALTGNFNPAHIAAGPDGNLWFTEVAGNRVGRITTAGVITEFDVPTPGSQPFGIAAGPDGNLWFTERAANKIGRITPGGVVTEFPVLTAGAYPWAIAKGPDGNLWFTEQNANKIGRISPAGVVTEFAIPTAGSQPFGIALGPDGNLWFTEDSGNAIGRISP